MKLKKIKRLKDGERVKCSFCGEKTAWHNIKWGVGYGGRSCCFKCFSEDEGLQNSKRLDEREGDYDTQ